MGHKVMTLMQAVDSDDKLDLADAELEAALDNGYAIERIEIYWVNGLMMRLILLVKRTPEPDDDTYIPF